MSLVGLVVEPIVDVVSGSVPATIPSDGSDFAINDLYFQVKSSDQTPYQRATAQFRKDQYDTGREAGDQSLTGWWTRGQFSFHKGAGITYYEVSEGDTVINRFQSATGLDPFESGELTCQSGWTAYEGVFSALSYVAEVQQIPVVLDGTTVKYGDLDSPTSLVPDGSGTDVLGLTAGPKFGYIITDAGEVESFAPDGSSQTTLYSGLTTTPRGIWYVKSRLLINDSDGKWYQLAVNPDTPPNAVAPADVVFTGSDFADASVVCDTPGPILLANENRLFALTLDSTGTIPVLSAPVQVAELPPGEVVFGLAFHLGFVILNTVAGLRIGVLSDSGQVTYGPLLVESTGSVTKTTIGRYKTRVQAVVDSRLIEVDLSEQVGNGLEFAWTDRGNPWESDPGYGGAATFQQAGVRVAWDNTTIWADIDNPMAGEILTGYHRFATLEDKRFDSVRVVASGDGGTIAVSRVDADGTETSLYTLDLDESKSVELSLQMVEAAEAVALKFVLTPDGADAPTLLGYQLRALPAPQRQRMIRIPFMLNDIERRQPARSKGKAGGAWTRLQALEELEESNAIVNYRDFRTGETGRAFIEAVEFTNPTPPSANSSGFGGTLFVTLRRL